MPEVRLQSIGRAVPATTYVQQDLLVHSPWGRSPLLERLFLASDVHTRGFVVPPTFFVRDGRGEERSLTQTNAAWLAGALDLGGAALRDALDAAGREAGDVGFVAVTTVTGYATPGLDLLLARQEGLRNDVQRAHFNCIGCHAAVPLLRVARDHVLASPGTLAVAGAVEICSACFRDDDDPQNLVATALFADGAAVAVLGTEGDGPVLVDFGSLYDFEHLDALGFGLDSQGFRIVLDPGIPDRIAANIQAAVGTLLDRHGVRPDDVTLWAFHPGGARILDAVQRSLGLSDAAMRPSRRVLRAHGNMSSPSVLFVLAEALRDDAPTSGWGVMAAFGPGLGIEVALLAFGAP
ncbi:MAG: type III polyketide synthase [Alphaproteobacteria bacterium]|nr:type III polyketide synthase [Alphaproteobacteria bacterium]